MPSALILIAPAVAKGVLVPVAAPTGLNFDSSAVEMLAVKEAS